MAKGKATKPSPNGQHPTAAMEWRKAREVGELVPLPSGYWVRLRTADIMKMVRSGFIPDFLSAVAVKATWSDENTQEIASSTELAEKYDDLMKVVLPAVFAEPKMAIDGELPKDDEITIDDLDITDRITALNLAIAGVGAMRNFRKLQEQSLAPLYDGDENGEPSE